MKKTKLIFTVLKFVILIILVIVLPLYIVIYKGEVISEFQSFEDVITFLKQYETQSIFIYIGIQILQIVISVIPGQAFQFAAGSLYGFIPGLIYSVIGAALGTTVSFFLAKILGKDAMHLIVGDNKMAYFVEKLNSKKAFIIVFILYLIPGLPKDIVSYAAGVSEMKFKPFLILSLIGRIPGMSGSLLIGAFYMKKLYTGMFIVGTIAVISFIICFIKRKRIMVFLDEFYEKIS